MDKQIVNNILPNTVNAFNIGIQGYKNKHFPFF